MTRQPALLFTLVLLGTVASANTLYWGGGNTTIPNGTLLPNAITSLPGTWDLTTANWSTTTNGVTYTNWPSTGTANAAYIGYGLATTPTGIGYITQAVNMALNQLTVVGPAFNENFQLTATSPVSLTLNGSTPTITLAFASSWPGSCYLLLLPNVALAGTNGFTQTGMGALRVSSDCSGLRGTVVVSPGSQTLSLESGGKLTGVDSFIVQVYPGDPGGFVVQPPSAGSRDDMGDASVVRLQGGEFTYAGYRHATSPSTESIGSIVLDSWGELNPTSANGSGQNGRLYTGIDRGPNGKGTLTVGGLRTGPDFATDIIVTNQPTGVILPWMQNSRGYALWLTGTGAITNMPWTPAPRDLSAWQANQDYRSVPASGSADPFLNAISTDLTIHSLGAEINGNNLNNQVITIGTTNTLIVSSGYIGLGNGGDTYNSLTITGGTLTTTTNDLYFFAAHQAGSLYISSAITGAINVVTGGGAAPNGVENNVIFSGATTNSYTGTTYVQGHMNLQKPNYVMAIPGNLDIGTVGLLSISTLGQIYANASIMNRGAISYTCNPGPTFSGTVTNQGGSIYLNGYRLFTLNGPGTGFAFNGGLVSVPNVNCDFNLLTDVSCDASSQHQAIFSGAGNIWLAAGSSTIRTFNLTDSATLPAGTSEMVVAPSFRQSGGTASLRKTGSGVLELTGINTYTGTNTIDAGTLLANSALATGYGSVIVTNTGTLGGTGIVLGAVSVYSGASLTPGLWASAGTLTVSNNVNLKTGSTFNVGLSGSGNGLLICSNLTLAGYVSPTPLPGYTMPYSGAWTIATVLGAGTIDKTGATTPPGYTLKVTGSNLILNKPSTGMTCFFK